MVHSLLLSMLNCPNLLPQNSEVLLLNSWWELRCMQIISLPREYSTHTMPIALWLLKLWMKVDIFCTAVTKSLNFNWSVTSKVRERSPMFTPISRLLPLRFPWFQELYTSGLPPFWRYGTSNWVQVRPRSRTKACRGQGILRDVTERDRLAFCEGEWGKDWTIPM